MHSPITRCVTSLWPLSVPPPSTLRACPALHHHFLQHCLKQLPGHHLRDFRWARERKRKQKESIQKIDDEREGGEAKTPRSRPRDSLYAPESPGLSPYYRIEEVVLRDFLSHSYMTGVMFMASSLPVLTNDLCQTSRCHMPNSPILPCKYGRLYLCFRARRRLHGLFPRVITAPPPHLVESVRSFQGLSNFYAVIL